MRQMFKIGEVARLFGMNIRTLRYYDQIGLLLPVYVDENTGYRYYSSEQFEQLNTIRYLRTQGVPIAEIAAHLHQRKPEEILNMLRSQQKLVEQQLNQLAQTRIRLAARVEQIEDALRPDMLGKIRFEQLPRRPVAVLRRSLRAGEDLELPLRHLENNAGLVPSYFLGKVGLTMPLEALLNGRWEEYDSLFCLVEAGEEPEGTAADMLPRGMWALLRFGGTHKDAAPHYQQLLRELSSTGKKPIGAAAEFTLVDYGLTDDPSRFVTEIQIPVG